MSPSLESLIKLQHIETQIAEAKSAIATHPQRVAEADARLGEARAALDVARKRLADNQETRRALEKDVALYQGRLSKFRDQQGAVKTNREYQALGHEIETAQQEMAAAEERVIERMVEADTVAAEVKTAEATFNAQQKQVEAEKKMLAEDLAGVEASLTRVTQQRTDIIGSMEPRLLALFEQVSRARKGTAVTTATREGLCSACHVRLRPPVFQQVRANEAVIQCESCQRILYYVPPPPPIEQPVVRTGPA
jgi:predicted  nucleic acid-binding Zn-ribbon protein